MSIDTVRAPQPEASPAARPGRAADLALGAAALTMGLLAGLFYAYSVSVMPGLGEADDRTLVDGMQQINEAIENPVFFVSFLGAPVLILAALMLEHPSGARQVVRWVSAALVLDVGGDPVQPRPQRPRAIEAREPPPAAQQDLLQRVFGVLQRTQHPVAVRVQPVAIGRHERRECFVVAAQGRIECALRHARDEFASRRR